ncbi:MAG: sulfotransferase, partial [Planctomycetota bacterium]
KTLRHFLLRWGYRHQTYDLEAFHLYRAGQKDDLHAWMQRFDSFEDWPWPLMYREIDSWFPDAKFILTLRDSDERWYRSLCKMAVRMGPLNDFERHIYGYTMPQGRKSQHLEFYHRHNEEVMSYFNDRPHKLLRLCWETGEGVTALPEFLGQSPLEETAPNLNESLPVYGGDSLWRAHLSRVTFQTKWKLRRLLGGLKRRWTT